MSKTREMIIISLAIALVYIATAFINVRLPLMAQGGLIHLGNVPLFIFAIVFGPKVGAVSGAIGMGLFDLLSGWVLWAPFTVVIVGTMGYVVGALTKNHKAMNWYVSAIVAACAIKVVGYYIAEGFIYGNWVAPLASVPGNLCQIGVAAVVALPIASALGASKVFVKNF